MSIIYNCKIRNDTLKIIYKFQVYHVNFLSLLSPSPFSFPFTLISLPAPIGCLSGAWLNPLPACQKKTFKIFLQFERQPTKRQIPQKTLSLVISRPLSPSSAVPLAKKVELTLSVPLSSLKMERIFIIDRVFA